MITQTQLQQKIISILIRNDSVQSSGVYDALVLEGHETSLVSVKRNLTEMVRNGTITIHGGGRSTFYKVTTLGRIFFEIDSNKYIAIEPDRRYGLTEYNFDLFPDFPNEIFATNELSQLESATKDYHQRTRDISATIEDKELQRLVIELSWKSSKIEGNTYTLLDTEKLILEGKEAPGHTKNEARMILNHKDAFNFVRENKELYRNLTEANIEKLHSILIKELGVTTGYRKSLVGITGSKYKPLDNIYQINEAIRQLIQAVSGAKDPYTKALLALIGVSYIQPFEDGNKRTGRLLANAILLAHSCAPLSYRSVEEGDYRSAVLVFYELNSVVPIKKIFIDQYLFAAKNYAVN